MNPLNLKHGPCVLTQDYPGQTLYRCRTQDEPYGRRTIPGNGETADNPRGESNTFKTGDQTWFPPPPPLSFNNVSRNASTTVSPDGFRVGKIRVDVRPYTGTGGGEERGNVFCGQNIVRIRSFGTCAGGQKKKTIQIYSAL